MREIHRIHDEGNCHIHRLYPEDEEQDPTRFTEIDEKYGDDFEGKISYTSASGMEKPVYLVSGDTPRAKDNHYYTEDEKRPDGLLRVIALKPIVIDGYGVIEIGSRGGLIASEDNLEQGTGAWVGDGAVVLDDAVVADSALVIGKHAHPDQRCVLMDSCLVADGALVFDSHLNGSVSVEGNVEAYECVFTDNAFAYGDRNGERATVLIDVIMQGNTTIEGNPTMRSVHMTQKAHVSGEAQVQDSILVDGVSVRDQARVIDSIIGGDTRVYEEAVIEESTIRGGSIICGTAKVSGQLDVVDSVMS